MILKQSCGTVSCILYINFQHSTNTVVLCYIYYYIISGSPYTLEIVDTSMVSAKGEGLSSVEINRKASFLVETHGASGGNIRATVTSKSLEHHDKGIIN